jgi:hypothetical protein
MQNGMCVNGELYSTRVISTFERFSSVYVNQAHFSFTFLTKLTHDDPYHLQLADKPLNEALERLKTRGLFDSAVILIFGDHGQRISTIQYSYSGRIEERTPFMSIHIPAKYRSAFKEKYKNFIVNKVSFWALLCFEFATTSKNWSTFRTVSRPTLTFTKLYAK